MIDILQALLTPTIGFIAVYIAWRQHQTARAKLRLDLFEKRYAVYNSLLDYLGYIVREAKVTHECRREFLIGTRQAVFLFRPEVAEYLTLLHKRGVDFMTIGRALSPEGGLPAGDRRSDLVEKDSELLTWFAEQHAAAEKLFWEYLHQE